MRKIPAAIVDAPLLMDCLAPAYAKANDAVTSLRPGSRKPPPERSAGAFQRVAKAPRFRGNPFLPAYAGQKFSWLRCPVFAAPVAAGLQKADRGPCSASAVSAAGSASASQSLISPWGQNLAQNRALGFIASHTLCAKFSCMCPARMHMSSGRDYF